MGYDSDVVCGGFFLVVCLFLFGNSVNALCPYNQNVSLVVICFSL